MRILIIGSGGREHAIGLKISQQNPETILFFAPGNAGTASLGTNLEITDTDIESLLKTAKEKKIELTIVGPETPLVMGIVDSFNQEGLRIVGPSKEAAQLEGSKEWAKNLMKKYKIPTAAYEVFTNYEKSSAYIKKRNTYPIVIKADGLAAGKGVTVAMNETDAIEALKTCFLDKAFSEAGLKVVIEDFLEGEEASIFAFTDGHCILPMTPAQDHKAIFDGDKGPNTGGMGAYSPAPLVTQAMQEKVMKTVFKPLLNAFQKEGLNYKGIVYAGLMINKNDDVSIVEFNARFGDPETQVVLPRLQTNLIDIFNALVDEQLNKITLNWSDDYSVCIVMAADGYPGSYKKGYEITGIDKVSKQNPNSQVIQAGTRLDDNKIVSNGGRVLTIVSTDSTLKKAIDSAYKSIELVHFDKAYYRKDIGAKGLIHKAL
jgi:phosphoribosylamine--glycine ligase